MSADLHLRHSSLKGNSVFTTQTENNRGEWVPAIPLPLYGLRKSCRCGRRFWTQEGYRGHYALEHILALGEPSRNAEGR